MQLMFRAGAVLAAVIMVSACEDPGKVVRVPGATAASTTSAATTSATAQTDEQRLRAGTLAEGNRMAEVLALSTDIDPVFVRHGQAGVLTEPMLTIMTGHNNAISSAAAANGLLTGFVGQRSNGGDTSAGTDWLTHGIMRFPDTASAKAAAAALATAATTQRGMLQTGDWAAADLPGASDTRFVTMENRDRLEGMAFTAHREFVVFTSARLGGLPEIERTVRTALERQRPLLDSFVATPVAELAKLPYDPDGINALAVGNGNVSSGAYGPRGALIFTDDQQAALTLYREVGLVGIGIDDSAVYRTADAAAAAKLSAATVAETLATEGWKGAPAPDGVPGAACWTDADALQWACLVSSGRHVAQIWAKSQGEAHALTGEQHRALAAAK
ncbi:hypothetical protein ACFWPK_24980 [Nocardia sp. NPDC058519]|uniref:DUF7373 family lipoprotein n=1 Tax=Nocardia sp. NPDC058519 TaxID=3346535 RepID=UPI003668FC6D